MTDLPPQPDDGLPPVWQVVTQRMAYSLTVVLLRLWAVGVTVVWLLGFVAQSITGPQPSGPERTGTLLVAIGTPVAAGWGTFRAQHTARRKHWLRLAAGTAVAVALPLVVYPLLVH